MNMSLSKKCNVLFSLVTNNSPMNRFFNVKFNLMSKSYVKYIPLLCRIWPTFKQKKIPVYQQRLGMIQTHVPKLTIFLSFCRQSSVHSSANYIHCSVELSILISQFTIIHNSHPNYFPYVRLSLAVELSVFL